MLQMYVSSLKLLAGQAPMLLNALWPGWVSYLHCDIVRRAIFLSSMSQKERVRFFGGGRIATDVIALAGVRSDLYVENIGKIMQLEIHGNSV